MDIVARTPSNRNITLSVSAQIPFLRKKHIVLLIFRRMAPANPTTVSAACSAGEYSYGSIQQCTRILIPANKSEWKRGYTLRGPPVTLSHGHSLSLFPSSLFPYHFFVRVLRHHALRQQVKTKSDFALLFRRRLCRSYRLVVTSKMTGHVCLSRCS